MSSGNRHDWAALAALVAAACFAHISQGTLGLDGIRYGQIAKHIVESGNYMRLYDAYIEAPYVNKPPLLFWLTALSFRVFGYSTGAAKLFCAGFAAAGLALLWSVAARAWGAVAGWISVAIIVTSPIFFRAVVDLNFEAMVMFGAMLVLGAMLRSTRSGRVDSQDVLAFGAGVALLLATKPPYIVFCGMPMAVASRAAPEWRSARVIALLAGSALVGLAWIPFVNQQGYFIQSAENQLREPFLRDSTFLENAGRWIELMVAHLGPVTIAGAYALRRTLQRASFRALPAEDRLLILWALPIVFIIPLANVRLRYVLVPSLSVLLLAGREISAELPDLSAAMFRRCALGVSVLVLLLACVPLVPMHVPDPFVAYLRAHPEARVELPPLCVRDGARGDVEAPTQRRLEMLLDFELGLKAKAYGSETIPKAVWDGRGVVLADDLCADLLVRAHPEVSVLEHYPEGLARMALGRSAAR